MKIQLWFIKNDTRKYKVVECDSRMIMPCINKYEEMGYTYSGMKETIKENM